MKAVKRTDAIFDLERTIEGAHIATRLAALREEAAPRVADLELWMRSERKTPLPPRDVAQAMDHMLKRWDRFTRILDGGRRICLINNAAERALRGAALGRKA